MRQFAWVLAVVFFAAGCAKNEPQGANCVDQDQQGHCVECDRYTQKIEVKKGDSLTFECWGIPKDVSVRVDVTATLTIADGSCEKEEFRFAVNDGRPAFMKHLGKKNYPLSAQDWIEVSKNGRVKSTLQIIDCKCGRADTVCALTDVKVAALLKER